MSAESIANEKMSAAIDHFKAELMNIRTGRANPGMLDSIQVEVYGTNMRLKDVASVNTPEARQLLVAPFDGNNAGPIAKAIEKANLGFQCSVEGGQVRVSVPSMDENMRKEMVKLVKKLQEECKISIRNVRRDCNDAVKKEKADGDITEDDQKRLEKVVQDLTDKFTAQADKISEAKQEEVMQI